MHQANLASVRPLALLDDARWTDTPSLAALDAARTQTGDHGTLLRGAHRQLRQLARSGLLQGRASEHTRTARRLADEGASAERVAARLLDCRPAGDRWAYERLVAAARLVSTRGAADAAARYLRRALAEPPPPEHRVELLLELAAAESKASEPVSAIAHLREALAGEIEPDQRHRATMLVAGLLGHTGRGAEAVELLEQQIEALAAQPDLRAAAEAALTNIARLDPALRARSAPVVGELRRRVEAGDDRDPAVLGTIAMEMAIGAEPADRSAELAARALAGFDAAATAAPDWSGPNALRTLVLCGRYDAVSHILDRALERARERGAAIDVGAALAVRAELSLHTGDLAGAELHARALHEIATAYGWPLGEAMALAWLGETLLERGEPAEAERLLESGAFAAPAAAVPPGYMSAEVLLARGRLRRAQGRVDEAVEDLRESGRRQTASQNLSPAVTAWRSQLAHALVDLGDTAQARRLAEAELELARAVGAPRALGVALRAIARIEGGDDEIRLLREAADMLDASGAQLERARAHADLGAALRRAGRPREARDPLRLAVDLAHRCGADVLEDHALAELRATGARPRRRLATGTGALTPSERRIAELAAAGELNREIADTLVVTIPTVEFHLRNGYRKLGIASRSELPGALGHATPGGPPAPAAAAA